MHQQCYVQIQGCVSQHFPAERIEPNWIITFKQCATWTTQMMGQKCF